jgi:hypothetical protein
MIVWTAKDLHEILRCKLNQKGARLINGIRGGQVCSYCLRSVVHGN